MLPKQGVSVSGELALLSRDGPAKDPHGVRPVDSGSPMFGELEQILRDDANLSEQLRLELVAAAGQHIVVDRYLSTTNAG
eukprot:scaffold5763_cov249-Pinguiococcus_pyrenoidosus.AAC.6